jgi:protein polybromo-1
MDPHIYHIERLFEREGGSRAIWARQFFMQRETFHVPNRTFFEKEVMQGDIHNSVPISKVMGKCIVMAHKDYFKMKPEGFEEKDIFVCEWRYFLFYINRKVLKTAYMQAWSIFSFFL